MQLSKYDSKGLPCKHILHVLNALNLPAIPKCCILRRFTKKARSGLPVKRTSDLFSWGWTGKEARARYSTLSSVSAEAPHIACHNPFLFDKMLAAMKEVIANKDILNNEEPSQQSFVSNDEFQPKQNHILIRDPVKVSTKGAPKQNIRGQGKNAPEVTKNGRPKAFNEKSGRLCKHCAPSPYMSSGYNTRI